MPCRNTKNFFPNATFRDISRQLTPPGRAREAKCVSPTRERGILSRRVGLTTDRWTRYRRPRAVGSQITSFQMGHFGTPRLEPAARCAHREPYAPVRRAMQVRIRSVLSFCRNANSLVGWVEALRNPPLLGHANSLSPKRTMSLVGWVEALRNPPLWVPCRRKER